MLDTAALTEAMTKALMEAGYANISIEWAPLHHETAEVVGKVMATKQGVWVRSMVSEEAARRMRPELLRHMLVRGFDRTIAAHLKESEE